MIRLSRWKVLSSCLAGYALCAATAYRDVVTRLATRVLGGSFVGGIFVWETWWFDRCRRLAMNPFFTRQLMHPMGVPLVVESPLTALFGLILCPWTGPYRAVNVLFLLNYVLSGTAMAALALELTEDAAASFLAGFFFMFSQYAIVEHILGHLHECTLYPLPLLYLGAILVIKGRRGGWLLFTAALWAAVLASVYVTLDGVVVGLTAFLLLFARGWKSPRPGLAARQMIASASAAAALAAFAYLPAFVWRRDLIGGNGFYSLSVLSFFDLPAWHTAAWVQAVRLRTAGLIPGAALGPPGRRDFAFRSSPEQLTGFFGLTVPALIAWAAWRGRLARARPWLAFAAVGAVLALGPKLQWDYRGGLLPLPYALFQRFSLLRGFRAPSRMIVLSWIGLCALAACGFSGLTKGWKPWARALLAGGLMAAYSGEMALGAIGGYYTPVPETGVLQRLGASPEPGAVLEVPVQVFGSGDVSLSAERFMLYAPLHGRPLLVARPVRYTYDSLDFSMTEPLAFQLTHPQALDSLMKAPAAVRRRVIAKGLAAMRQAGVRFVLYHPRDGFFSPAVHAEYRALLDASFGTPVDADEAGNVLFRLR